MTSKQKYYSNHKQKHQEYYKLYYKMNKDKYKNRYEESKQTILNDKHNNFKNIVVITI